MSYNYTITLRPYSRDGGGVVQIDPDALYGYWEYPDGTEGGGLWFEQGSGYLELVDYDGAFELPRKIVSILRGHGFRVGDDF